MGLLIPRVNLILRLSSAGFGHRNDNTVLISKTNYSQFTILISTFKESNKEGIHLFCVTIVTVHLYEILSTLSRKPNEFKPHE